MMYPVCQVFRSRSGRHLAADLTPTPECSQGFSAQTLNVLLFAMAHRLQHCVFFVGLVEVELWRLFVTCGATRRDRR